MTLSHLEPHPAVSGCIHYIRLEGAFGQHLALPKVMEGIGE